MMSQKEEIVELLKVNKKMSCNALKKAIFGAKNSSPGFYTDLNDMIKNNVIDCKGNNPSYYSLSHKVSNDSIEEIEKLVQATNNYGPENVLIEKCLTKFQKNTDPVEVAIKIALIDITNSTHLSLQKSKISIVELADKITSIKDLDKRIKNGDPEVVNEIARSNGRVNLFSFASKYCHYHNSVVYGEDDYSIFDTVLKKSLPKYFNNNNVNKQKIEEWRKDFKYEEYNKYITDELDNLQITVKNRKRKFDHFVWYLNR